MKYLISPLFVTLLASSAFGSSDVMKKLDEKINKLEKNPITTSTKAIQVPWSLHDKREAQLWISIVNAYDMLKSNARTERYNFMYEAMKATSLGHPNRITALNAWISKENARMLSMGMNKAFYDKWNAYVEKIHFAIRSLSAERPLINVPFEKSNAEYISFLKSIREDLKNAPVVTSSDPQSSSVQSEIATAENYSNMMILIGACLAFFSVGYAVSQRKKPVRKVVQVRREVVYRDAPGATDLPSLPEEAFEKNDSIMEAVSNKADYSTSIEEECRKVLIDNQHLLEVAELRLTPMARSPFKSNVNVPSETVSEALQWLLKGTIAIANTSGSKISHMEWKCIENQGRVSLDFILHGLECDSKSLYLNALVDGDASAPAHFNRTETTLDGFGANVSFRSGNKKTVVSLGMDSLTDMVSH